MSKSICLNFSRGNITCELCIEKYEYYGKEGILKCYKKPGSVIIKRENNTKCQNFSIGDKICQECKEKTDLERKEVPCFQKIKDRAKYSSEICAFCGGPLSEDEKKRHQKYCSRKCYGLSKIRGKK